MEGIGVADEQRSTPIAESPVPIFAWDFSGSTCNMAYYHAVGAKYLDKFLVDHKLSSTPAPIFLIWDDHAKQVTLETLRNIITTKSGNGGTTASSIITWIQKNIGCRTPISLWLVTDGELLHEDLVNCSRLNRELDMNYVTLNFIIISQYSKINMSVGAAFFSGSKVKIFMNEQLFKEIDTSELFDYDKINATNFDLAVQELSDYIQAKFMGTELQGLEEVDKLSKLRLSLFKEIDSQEQQKYDGKKQIDGVEWKNKEEMMLWLKNTKYYKNLKDIDIKDFRTKVDSSISTLINYIHNKNKNCQFFDLLKMDYKQDKVGFTTSIQPNLDIDLESLKELPEKCSFFDSVTLEVEQSTPVLLLQITDLIDKFWVNGNYKKFNRMAECPLFGEFDDCMGHVFGLATVKQLFHSGSSQFRNPMTNKPCYGGLIPHSSFDQWNDYLLMITFFRGKNIKTCHALLYYRIWKYSTTCEWIDPAVVNLLEQYAFRRISNARCRLAFGSLAMDPTEVVPLPLAIFYCVEGSSLLFSQDPQLFLNERLRQYYPVSNDFLKIMEKLGIPCDVDLVTERTAIFKVVSLLKIERNRTARQYTLLSNMFKKEGKFVTFEVNEDSAFPIRFLALLNYSHKSMIPFTLPAINIYDLIHISYQSVSDALSRVPILPDTLRPRFALQEEGRIIPNYKQILRSVTEVELEPASGRKIASANNNPAKLDQTKLLSLNKLYINFIIENKRYPTLDDFEDFVWKEKRFNGDRIRLFPTKVKTWIRNTFMEYQDIVKELSLEEFISKGTRGIEIKRRLDLEGVKDTNIVNANFIERSRKKWLI